MLSLDSKFQTSTSPQVTQESGLKKLFALKKWFEYETSDYKFLSREKHEKQNKVLF